MNAFAIIVLVALVGEFLLGLVADLCNLRALDPELPEEFRDSYDAEAYRKSQSYTRERTRFGFWPDVVNLGAVLAFWFFDGFDWLDRAMRGLGFGPIVTGLLFMGALVVGRLVLNLPFRWYSTFVIEERYGFNKTTPKTFVSDLAKGVLLSLILGAPLLALILWFFGRDTGLEWVWCWAAVTAFTVVIQLVAPTWIMPLFNKFETLEDGDLKKAVLNYAEGVSFPLEGLFVIDGSRRSTKANAFFTGFGKRKRVALFDTLIEKHPTDELVAVVAHEIGHYKLRHILQGLILGVLQMGATFFVLSIVLKAEGLYAAFGMQQPSVYAGLVFFGLLFTPIDLVLSLLMNAFSRKNEFEADRFARETTGDGERLAVALKRLSADSLSNLTPHPLYVLLHHSHPPVLERIQALRG